VLGKVRTLGSVQEMGSGNQRIHRRYPDLGVSHLNGENVPAESLEGPHASVDLDPETVVLEVRQTPDGHKVPPYP